MTCIVGKYSKEPYLLILDGEKNQCVKNIIS